MTYSHKVLNVYPALRGKSGGYNLVDLEALPNQRATKDRKRPFKVYVNPIERDEIEQRAASVGLTPSSYLCNVGLGYQPKSTFDQDAILELVKLHADQGRLGGLLKLWLTEKPGEGARVKDVRALLNQIESLQVQLARLVMTEALKQK